MGPDPEIVIGRGRALLRAVDLMELASLVKRLSNREALDEPENLRMIMPQL
jgi:hypothetical protein